MSIGGVLEFWHFLCSVYKQSNITLQFIIFNYWKTNLSILIPPPKKKNPAKIKKIDVSNFHQLYMLPTYLLLTLKRRECRSNEFRNFVINISTKIK